MAAERPAPTPSIGKPRHPLPPPIGEVHVLVYGWERGRTEVRVRFPAEATTGDAAAASKQQQFRRLVLDELDESFKLLTE